MINYQRVLPGKRAVLIGIDLLSLTIAQQMSAVGMQIQGVVMPPPGPLAGEYGDPRRMVDELLRLAAWAPSAGVRLAGRLLHGRGVSDLVARFFPREGIKVWDIPVMPRRAALEIRGNGAVQSVVLADLTTAGEPDMQTAHEVEVDVVCTSAGLVPLTELPEIAGCKLSHIADLGGNVPLHGPALQTTVETVFVAGSVTGVEGAPIAILQGRLAGYAAAHAAGRISQVEHEAHVQRMQEEITDARRDALPLYPRAREGRALLGDLWRQEHQAGVS
jgi:sarcosine oxidase subunit alpha